MGQNAADSSAAFFKKERHMKKTTWHYTLCGSLTGVIPAAVLLAVFGTVTVLLRKANNGAFFVTGALALFVLAVIGYAFWRHCFHRLDRKSVV